MWNFYVSKRWTVSQLKSPFITLTLYRQVIHTVLLWLPVTFSLNLRLNLDWEANSWVLDTLSINTEGSHTEGPTVWRLHSREPYLQYFQTCEWTISHLQSYILFIVNRIICWVSVRLLSQFIWRTIVSNSFVCLCALCTTVNKCECTILRVLWLGGEQLLPGLQCPTYLCFLVSQMKLE